MPLSNMKLSLSLLLVLLATILLVEVSCNVSSSAGYSLSLTHTHADSSRHSCPRSCSKVRDVNVVGHTWFLCHKYHHLLPRRRGTRKKFPRLLPQKSRDESGSVRAVTVSSIWCSYCINCNTKCTLERYGHFRILAPQQIAVFDVSRNRAFTPDI